MMVKNASAVIFAVGVAALVFGAGGPAVSGAPAPASAAAGAGAGDCTPPVVEATVHRALRATTVIPSKSPPAASVTSPPRAGTAKRVIPIGRLKPWAERCPPPAQTRG